MHVNEANIHVATAADFLPRFGKPILCDVLPDKDVQMRIAVFLEFQHTDKRETLALMLSREQNALKGKPGAFGYNANDLDRTYDGEISAPETLYFPQGRSRFAFPAVAINLNRCRGPKPMKDLLDYVSYAFSLPFNVLCWWLLLRIRHVSEHRELTAGFLFLERTRLAAKTLACCSAVS